MRIGIISGVIGLFVTLSVHAQKSDSIKSMLLPDVVVTETYQQRQAKKSALTVDVADQDFLRKHFTGNFMQAMENIPGVQAMDIGSGFSKPACDLITSSNTMPFIPKCLVAYFLKSSMLIVPFL